MPSLLFRYMVRGNIMLLIPTLAVGIGLYVLTDLFERLDNFIEAGVSFSMVAGYFVAKAPLVISQILPVIFLLSTTIQLCLMARNRELVALQAGGISLARIGGMLLICGVFWGVVQLGFSEVLGVRGERESARIWQEEVRKRNLAQAVLRDIWFTDGAWVISLDTLHPNGQGGGLTAYNLSEDGLGVEQIVKAPTFAAALGRWRLYNASVYDPSTFSVGSEQELILSLNQDPSAFRLLQGNTKLQQLPLWDLGKAIDRLAASGSNVEGLRTSWHMKLAYAASLVVLALVATALVSFNNNIFIATTLALVSTFIYYAVYTVGTAMAQRGTLPPWVGAWLADALATALAMARLLPMLLRRESHVG